MRNTHACYCRDVCTFPFFPGLLVIYCSRSDLQLDEDMQNDEETDETSPLCAVGPTEIIITPVTLENEGQRQTTNLQMWNDA